MLKARAHSSETATPEAAVAIVGIDAVNVDDLGDLSRPVHTLLLGANIGIVTSYNDVLSAHQPFATFPEIIPTLIDALHTAGLLVMTPHTNDAAEAAYFARIGVDVIASDDPKILGLLSVN